MFIGIDVAKEHLDIMTRPDGQYWQVPQTEAGWQQLIDRLQPMNPELIVVEATGGYERAIVSQLALAGLAIAVVNPRRVRDFAKASQQLAKTDRIDAGVLAHFAETFRPKPVVVSDIQQEQMQEWSNRRNQLVQMRTQEYQRLGTCRSTSRQSIQEHIEWLSARIDEIDTTIQELIAANDEWQERSQTLQSVPGVGPQTVQVLIADLPELGTLSHKEIAALVGVAPLNHESGKMHGQRRVWGGRAQVRRSLYMATLSAMRWNPRIKAFAERLTGAGKLPKVAIVACMHKLLTHLNALLKTRSQWRAEGAGH